MRIQIGGDQHARRSAAIGLISADAAVLPIAQRLAAAGHRVSLHVLDRTLSSERTPRIETAATPTDVAAECDVVLSTIEDSETLRELLIGSAERPGLGQEMAPGSVFVDLGIRPARETQALLGILGTRGVAVIDAAVIGVLDGDGGSKPEATVLVGGYPDAVAQASRPLSCIGRVEITGPLGSAHTAAALMGYMEAAQAVAEQEAVSVGRALGLSDATLARVIEPSAKSTNVVRMARRLRIAGQIAADRGVSADVIDFTDRKLPKGDDG